MTSSKHPLQIRGLMLDCARMVERHEYYFDLLPRLARWGINTLWLHFADDEGFRLKLRGHPEIAAPFAFSKDEMRRLIDQAGSLGIDVVPEVEALGHTRYITGLPQYAHLADGDSTYFNAICPSHNQTIGLLGEIIEEVAELFPSPFFHAGMDEVNFSGCPRCRRRAKGHPAWWIFAQHALAMNDIVRQYGKRMILWADHVEHQNAMLRALPKDIVLAHWHYRDIRPEAIHRSLRAGFQVITAPSLCHYGKIIHPAASNFQNMDDMTEFCASAGKGVLGAVNTWWNPWRGLRDAYLPAIAYTGAMLRAAKPLDKGRFMQGFLKSEFGPAAAPAGEALWQSYTGAIDMYQMRGTLFTTPAQMHDGLALAQAADFPARLEQAGQCAKILAKAAKSAKRGRVELAAIALGAEVDRVCLENAQALKQMHQIIRQAELRRDMNAPAGEIRQRIAEVKVLLKSRLAEIDRITRLVEKDWDRTRFPNDPNKCSRDIAIRPSHRDSLMGKLCRHRQYLRNLIKSPGVLSPVFAWAITAAGGTRRRR